MQDILKYGTIKIILDSTKELKNEHNNIRKYKQEL